mmetsp:Transcript_64868/g.159668  ORF Transcript_64868/g.159668 Transcript_64868/m.159668 type:complete len:223 (-) Transcript_64868:2334-3002(-)
MDLLLEVPHACGHLAQGCPLEGLDCESPVPGGAHQRESLCRNDPLRVTKFVVLKVDLIIEAHLLDLCSRLVGRGVDHGGHDGLRAILPKLFDVDRVAILVQELNRKKVSQRLANRDVQRVREVEAGLGMNELPRGGSSGVRHKREAHTERGRRHLLASRPCENDRLLRDIIRFLPEQRGGHLCRLPMEGLRLVLRPLDSPTREVCDLVFGLVKQREKDARDL